MQCQIHWRIEKIKIEIENCILPSNLYSAAVTLIFNNKWIKIHSYLISDFFLIGFSISEDADALKFIYKSIFVKTSYREYE